MKLLKIRRTCRMSYEAYEDLIKAKRDITKLVQVERTVTNSSGTTFQRKYYVQPNEVLKTDKIIGNMNVFKDWRQQIKNPPKKGVLDTKYFDAIKGRRDKALRYLEECGITWKKDPHEAINWMHAMQAYTKATGQLSATQQAKTGASNTPTVIQPTTPKTPVASTTTNPAKSMTLTPSQQAEVDACKNGREKVVVLKKLIGRDGCMAYARSLGVKWDEHQHDAINNMRMSTALTQYFDSKDGTTSPNKERTSKKGKGGGAPEGNDNAKKDGTQVEEPAKPETAEIEITDKMSPRQQNLAKIINGISDTKTIKAFTEMRMVGEDKQATEFIISQLQKAYLDKKAGRSSYDSNRFRRNYPDDFGDSTSDELNKFLKGLPKKTIRKAIAELAGDISITQLLYPRETMGGLGSSGGSYGCTIYGNENDEAGNSTTFMAILNDTNSLFSSLTDPDVDNYTVDENGSHISTFGGSGMSPQGYAGLDTEKCKKQYEAFGIENYGFVRAMRRIQKEDPSVKATVDEMVSTYDEMLKLSGYSPKIMNMIIRENTMQGYENTFTRAMDSYKQQNVGTKKFIEILKDLKTTYNLTDEDIDASARNMYAYSRNEQKLIKADGTLVLDPQGNVIDLKELLRNETVDYTDYKGDTYQDSAWRYLGGSSRSLSPIVILLHSGKSDLTELTLEDVKSYEEWSKNHPTQYSDGISYSSVIQSTRSTIDSISDAKAQASVTKEAFCKVKALTLKLTGQKIQKTEPILDAIRQPTGDYKYTDLDLDNMTESDWEEFGEALNKYIGSGSGHKAEERGFIIVSNGDDEARDTILGNMNYMIANENMRRNISGNISYDATNSKANDNGHNYSANYDYFAPTQINYRKGVQITRYDTWLTTEPALGGPKELKKILDKQLDEVPVLSSKKLKEMREFMDEKGTTDGVDSSWNKWFNGNTPTRPKSENIVKARSYAVLSERNMEGFRGTPIYDMLFESVQSVAIHCPQIKNTRVKDEAGMRRYVEKGLDFVPYVPEGKSTPNSMNLPSNAELAALKIARQNLLSVANCSLATADDAERGRIETRVKHDWDKEKRDTSGKRLYGYISFKSNGVYKVNNSAQGEKFDKKVQDTGAQVTSLFHGTDFNGAGGILGRTGEWLIPKDSADAARMGVKYAGGMLGRGIYLADLAGKSAGYFGNWGSGYGKRGGLLICDSILGNCVTGQTHSEVRNTYNCDSVHVGAGANTGNGRVLRAEEWCVRSNDNIAPRYLVDAEAVSRT